MTPISLGRFSTDGWLDTPAVGALRRPWHSINRPRFPETIFVLSKPKYQVLLNLGKDTHALQGRLDVTTVAIARKRANRSTHAPDLPHAQLYVPAKGSVSDRITLNVDTVLPPGSQIWVTDTTARHGTG